MKNDEFEQWAEERRRRLAERRARRARPPEPAPEPSGQAEGRAQGEEGAEDPEAADTGPGRFGRKEKVLHTRISEALDDALRRASDELRVPVSNLVRNVLEDVFTVVDVVAESVEGFVEDVVGEAGDVRERLFGTRRARGHAHRRRSHEHGSSPRPGNASDDGDRAPERAEFPDVAGWQSLLLNSAQTCADCEELLPKGTRAFLGIPVSGPPKTYLCRDCMGARSTDASR